MSGLQQEAPAGAQPGSLNMTSNIRSRLRAGAVIGAMTGAAMLAACGGSGSGTGTASTAYPMNSATITLNASVPGAIAGGSVKRYNVAVTSGTQYVASLTGMVGDADLIVYTDGTFSIRATCAAPNTGKSGAAPEDCVVTASGSTLYLGVSNPGAANDSYIIRVAQQSTQSAASEGTSASPVPLVQGSAYAAAVGSAGSASSYYVVTTTVPTSINLTGLQSPQDIDMKIYSGSDFSTGPQACSYAGLAGVAPEECSLASGTWYIQVINNAAGVGGPYLLTAD